MLLIGPLICSSCVPLLAQQSWGTTAFGVPITPRVCQPCWLLPPPAALQGRSLLTAAAAALLHFHRCSPDLLWLHCAITRTFHGFWSPSVLFSVLPELPQAGVCVLELPARAGPGLGHLQALTPSCGSPNANTLPCPSVPPGPAQPVWPQLLLQAVGGTSVPQCPPPSPEPVLDPTIICVSPLSCCMEAAGGTGVLGGYSSPVPAGWRGATPVSPSSSISPVPRTCNEHISAPQQSQEHPWPVGTLGTQP